VSVKLDELQAEDFSALLGHKLVLMSSAGEVGCCVEAVRPLPLHALRRLPPFAVILRGPRGRSLPQGMYALGHPARGVLDVFIVPIGTCGDGLGYEITFN